MGRSRQPMPTQVKQHIQPVRPDVGDEVRSVLTRDDRRDRLQDLGAFVRAQRIGTSIELTSVQTFVQLEQQRRSPMIARTSLDAETSRLSMISGSCAQTRSIWTFSTIPRPEKP